MKTNDINWKLQFPSGTKISGSSKHSMPHGKANELKLAVHFGTGDGKDVGTCYLKIKVSDTGEAIFSLESHGE